MNDPAAAAFLRGVRRAGDELTTAFRALESEISPEEHARWRSAVAEAMGEIYAQLVEPICRENPSIVPKSLGGPAPD